ncbi:hypothetical protein T261_03646 [Streptomyces lydicus]|nr:hypothetical protein T261_03646 [Streptomyces lydicus]
MPGGRAPGAGPGEAITRTPRNTPEGNINIIRHPEQHSPDGSRSLPGVFPVSSPACPENSD